MYTFCPASCNGGLEQGGVNDRSDDTISKRCTVCIGSKFPGKILTSELECWKEDPIYSQYLSKTRDTVRSYVEYYTDIHRAYEIKEYMNGKFTTLSLRMFINNSRRIAECAHICASVTAIEIDDRYEARAKQKQVPCPCECINGIRLRGYSRSKCSFCSGRGYVIAYELVNWMSDPMYKSYFHSTLPNDTKSYDEWK